MGVIETSSLVLYPSQNKETTHSETPFPLEPDTEIKGAGSQDVFRETSFGLSEVNEDEKLSVYLGNVLAQLAGTGDHPVITWIRGVLSAFLGAISSSYFDHYHPFWGTKPVFWIILFWTFDWTLGSFRAVLLKEWSPTKAGFSFAKLIVWLIVLSAGWGVKESGMLGGAFLEGFLIFAVLSTELTSIFRNGSLVLAATGSPGTTWMMAVAEYFQGNLAERIDSLRKQSRRGRHARKKLQEELDAITNPKPGPGNDPT